jgi:hypothetical protein
MKAIAKRPAEMCTPPLFGRLVRVIGATPSITRSWAAGAEAKGRKLQEMYRKAQG